MFAYLSEKARHQKCYKPLKGENLHSAFERIVSHELN